MLYTLTNHLTGPDAGLGALDAPTLRSFLAFLTSLALSLLAGPALIRQLRAFQLGQTVRDDGPRSHKSKEGTPTMGGVLILGTLTLSTLLWADMTNCYVWLVLAVSLAFSGVGFLDDFLKIRRRSPHGLSARQKYLLQSVAAALAAGFLYWSASTPGQTSLWFPGPFSFSLPLGVFFPVFAYLVIVGTSNAVNLTDGLDGLAAVPVAMVGAGLGVVAWLSGHAGQSAHWQILHVPGAAELLVFAAALVGACIGFLWFNTHPALLFMGDTGSLGLGAALGTLAVLVHQEIALFIMGGVFVAETVSVILQVGSFKTTGRRIFRMAPLHHHFELKGWPETRVIVRFWILTLVLVVTALALLGLH